MATYRVVRILNYYNRHEKVIKQVIKKGVNLEEARAHCTSPKHSMATAMERDGKWFDCYEKENV